LTAFVTTPPNMKALLVTICLLSDEFVFLNQLVEKFTLQGYGLLVILVKPLLSQIIRVIEIIGFRTKIVILDVCMSARV